MTTALSPGLHPAPWWRHAHQQPKGSTMAASAKLTIVGQLKGKGFGMHTGRAQDAMHRRRRPKPHSRVNVVKAQLGRPAVRVWNARLHADPIADLQRSDIWTSFYHGARGLVP